MAAADLVVCRAGAISISELAALGRAAVLVPSPNVTGNHQYKNARALADRGAALLLTEEDLQAGALLDSAFPLLFDDTARGALAAKIGEFARPDAGRLILQDIKELLAAPR